MKCLFVDFEATGVDPKMARILEIGAVLWDSVKHETLCKLSTYVKHEGLIISDEITQLTGIDSKKVEKGLTLYDGLCALNALMDLADICCAHNSSYDCTLYHTECRRIEQDPRAKIWICSIQDVEYPPKLRCRKLSHLALDCGVSVNPSLLHSALADVELMMEMLRMGGFTVEQMHEYHLIPWVIVAADVNYDGNQMAKDRGYSWQKVRDSDTVFPKKWIKKLKENQIEKERSEAPFRVTVLG